MCLDRGSRSLSPAQRCGRTTPVSAITEGHGLNITVVSYRDHLDFGLIACCELVPDVDEFEVVFNELLSAQVRLAENVGENQERFRGPG